MEEEDIQAFPLEGNNLGMTLRDYFAGRALQGLLANFPVSENVIEQAYNAADEMLKQRTK